MSVLDMDLLARFNASGYHPFTAYTSAVIGPSPEQLAAESLEKQEQNAQCGVLPGRVKRPKLPASILSQRLVVLLAWRNTSKTLQKRGVQHEPSNYRRRNALLR